MENKLVAPGGTIAYTDSGGDGPVVLLVHGLGSDRRTWREVIPTLATSSRVIAPDLPGHGESDAPDGDYSLGAHATALRDLLLLLGVPQATVVGHSLGGGIALQFAYQFPERTARLALLASGGLGPEVSAMLRAATLPGASAVVAGLARMPLGITKRVLPMLPVLVAPEDAGSLAGALRGLDSPRTRAAFLRTAHHVISWRGQTVSAVRRLHLLTDLPVLVLWGANDRTIPPKHHRQFAQEVPSARTAEIPGAGHFLHETDAEAVLPHLQSFLAETDPFVYTEADWRVLLTDSEAGDDVAPPPTGTTA